MSEKYPYLNSVVFKNTSDDNALTSINKESLANCCGSSPKFTTSDHFEEVNLNGSDCSASDSQDLGGISSYDLDSDIFSDCKSVNHAKEFSHFPNHLPKSYCDSSVSSLSSIASTSDLSAALSNNFTTSCSLSSNASDSKLGDLRHLSSAQHNQQKSSTGFLSHISQLILGKQDGSSKSADSSMRSTTCLILNERPIGLPPKSPGELQRHLQEYNQLIDAIKRKEKQQNQKEKVKQKSKINQEERQYQLTTVWRNFIIPDWLQQHTSKYVRHLWWEGIPTSVRDKVWRLCIRNILKLTKSHYENFLSQMQERIQRYTETCANMCHVETDQPNIAKLRNSTHSSTSESRLSGYDRYISETVTSYNKRSSSGNYSVSTPTDLPLTQTSTSDMEMRQTLLNTIKLDVSRTFPSLNLFQEGGPHHDLLYQLLGAYTCYRPDIGYVQGMSFLAAVLILVMHVEDAFICFANILEMPCHHAFYGLDETEFTVYVETFKYLLASYLPQLGHHFQRNKLDVNMFLCDWLFTIYSRALTLETALRVWDLFCRDGETTLFRAGLGILRCYEMQLLNSDFEEMASFLTGQMPETLSPMILVEQMRAIKISRSKLNTTVSEIRQKLSSKKLETPFNTY